MSPAVDRLLRPFDRLLAVPAVWSFVDATFMRLAKGLRRRRNQVRIQQLTHSLASTGQVQSGPFSGLRYARFESACSTLLPKLLGTYEQELHPVLERLFGRRYERIIDIGCAEGYYAVGLALRFPQVPVVACDINPDALELCRLNAEGNGVASQVHLLTSATPESLARDCDQQRCLIVCDCEGFEGDIFESADPARFARSDLLIETHDYIKPGVHDRLRARFASTHQIEEFHSIDDHQKARTYTSPWVAGMDEDLREQIFAECRPVIMRWLLLTSRAN
jgi:SAM-dependent methyltransferase